MWRFRLGDLVVLFRFIPLCVIIEIVRKKVSPHHFNDSLKPKALALSPPTFLLINQRTISRFTQLVFTCQSKLDHLFHRLAVLNLLFEASLLQSLATEQH